MSARSFDETAMVAVLVGTVAIVGALQVFGPAKAESVPARTFRIASAQVERVQPPHYVASYTFARLSDECRAEVIAAKDKARCDAEASRAPVREDFQLKSEGTSFASLAR
jgi:hypothetical protein